MRAPRAPEDLHRHQEPMRIKSKGLLLGMLMFQVNAATAADQMTCEAQSFNFSEFIDCRRNLDAHRSSRCSSHQAEPLQQPASGPRLFDFDQRTQSGKTTRGVAYQSTAPAVTAPIAGRVSFAGAYRSYGNVVIIDACDIDVIVAGLSEVEAYDGMDVAQNQTIGSAAISQTIYLEVRKGGTPVDPFKYPR